MLNNSELKIDPWGTLNNISSYDLYEVFIFTLCFLQDRKLCVNFDADKLNPYIFNFAMLNSCALQLKAFERYHRRTPNVF